MIVDFHQVRAKRRAVRPAARCAAPTPAAAIEEPTIIAVGDIVQCPDGAKGRVMYFHAENHCVVSLGGCHCGTHRVERIDELLVVGEHA